MLINLPQPSTNDSLLTCLKLISREWDGDENDLRERSVAMINSSSSSASTYQVAFNSTLPSREVVEELTRPSLEASSTSLFATFEQRRHPHHRRSFLLSPAWEVAIQIFTASISSSLLPSIDHYNILLSLAAKERQWSVMTAVEEHMVSQQSSDEENERYDELQSGVGGADSASTLIGSPGAAEPQLEDTDTLSLITLEKDSPFVQTAFSQPPNWGSSSDIWLPKTSDGLSLLGHHPRRHRAAPNETTFQILMVASLEVGDWVNALDLFADLRDEYVPIGSDTVGLAMKAFRMSNQSSRGGSWESALKLFLSYRHRVSQGDVLHQLLLLLREAGQPQALIDAYLDSQRVLTVDGSTLALVCDACKSVGRWELAAAVASSMMGANVEKVLVSHAMSCAVLAAQRSANHVVRLYLQLRVWDEQAAAASGSSSGLQKSWSLLSHDALVAVARAAQVLALPALVEEIILDGNGGQEVEETFSGRGVSDDRLSLSGGSKALPLFSHGMVSPTTASATCVSHGRGVFYDAALVGTERAYRGAASFELCLSGQKKLLRMVLSTPGHHHGGLHPLHDLLYAQLQRQCNNRDWRGALEAFQRVKGPDALCTLLLVETLRQAHRWEESVALFTQQVVRKKRNPVFSSSLSNVWTTLAVDTLLKTCPPLVRAATAQAALRLVTEGSRSGRVNRYDRTNQLSIIDDSLFHSSSIWWNPELLTKHAVDATCALLPSLRDLTAHWGYKLTKEDGVGGEGELKSSSGSLGTLASFAEEAFSTRGSSTSSDDDAEAAHAPLRDIATLPWVAQPSGTTPPRGVVGSSAAGIAKHDVSSLLIALQQLQNGNVECAVTALGSIADWCSSRLQALEGQKEKKAGHTHGSDVNGGDVQVGIHQSAVVISAALESFSAMQHSSSSLMRQMFVDVLRRTCAALHRSVALALTIGAADPTKNTLEREMINDEVESSSSIDSSVGAACRACSCLISLLPKTDPACIPVLDDVLKLFNHLVLKWDALSKANAAGSSSVCISSLKRSILSCIRSSSQLFARPHLLFALRVLEDFGNRVHKGIGNESVWLQPLSPQDHVSVLLCLAGTKPENGHFEQWNWSVTGRVLASLVKYLTSPSVAESGPNTSSDGRKENRTVSVRLLDDVHRVLCRLYRDLFIVTMGQSIDGSIHDARQEVLDHSIKICTALTRQIKLANSPPAEDSVANARHVRDTLVSLADGMLLCMETHHWRYDERQAVIQSFAAYLRLRVSADCPVTAEHIIRYMDVIVKAEVSSASSRQALPEAVAEPDELVTAVDNVMSLLVYCDMHKPNATSSVFESLIMAMCDRLRSMCNEESLCDSSSSSSSSNRRSIARAKRFLNALVKLVLSEQSLAALPEGVVFRAISHAANVGDASLILSSWKWTKTRASGVQLADCPVPLTLSSIVALAKEVLAARAADMLLPLVLQESIDAVSSAVAGPPAARSITAARQVQLGHVVDVNLSLVAASSHDDEAWNDEVSCLAAQLWASIARATSKQGDGLVSGMSSWLDLIITSSSTPRVSSDQVMRSLRRVVDSLRLALRVTYRQMRTDAGVENAIVMLTSSRVLCISAVADLLSWKALHVLLRHDEYDLLVTLRSLALSSHGAVGCGLVVHRVLCQVLDVIFCVNRRSCAPGLSLVSADYEEKERDEAPVTRDYSSIPLCRVPVEGKHSSAEQDLFSSSFAALMLIARPLSPPANTSNPHEARGGQSTSPSSSVLCDFACKRLRERVIPDLSSLSGPRLAETSQQQGLAPVDLADLIQIAGKAALFFLADGSNTDNARRDDETVAGRGDEPHSLLLLQLSSDIQATLVAVINSDLFVSLAQAGASGEAQDSRSVSIHTSSASLGRLLLASLIARARALSARDGSALRRRGVLDQAMTELIDAVVDASAAVSTVLQPSVVLERVLEVVRHVPWSASFNKLSASSSQELICATVLTVLERAVFAVRQDDLLKSLNPFGKKTLISSLGAGRNAADLASSAIVKSLVSSIQTTLVQHLTPVLLSNRLSRQAAARTSDETESQTKDDEHRFRELTSRFAMMCVAFGQYNELYVTLRSLIPWGSVASSSGKQSAASARRCEWIAMLVFPYLASLQRNACVLPRSTTSAHGHSSVISVITRACTLAQDRFEKDLVLPENAAGVQPGASIQREENRISRLVDVLLSSLLVASTQKLSSSLSAHQNCDFVAMSGRVRPLAVLATTLQLKFGAKNRFFELWPAVGSSMLTTATVAPKPHYRLRQKVNAVARLTSSSTSAHTRRSASDWLQAVALLQTGQTRGLLREIEIKKLLTEAAAEGVLPASSRTRTPSQTKNWAFGGAGGDWIRATNLFSLSLDLGFAHTTAFISPRVTEVIFSNIAHEALAVQLLLRSVASVPHATRAQQLMGYNILCKSRCSIQGSTASNESVSSGGLSWTLAVRVFQASTSGIDVLSARRELIIPQRHMQEVIRHCVFNHKWGTALYGLYRAIPYETVQGPHAFLSTLRCARLHKDIVLANRVMSDFSKVLNDAAIILSASSSSSSGCDEGSVCDVPGFSRQGIKLVWRAYLACGCDPADIGRFAHQLRRHHMLDVMDEAELGMTR